MLLNRNDHGLIVSSVTIPQVVSESATSVSGEESQPRNTSKLLWSLAGVFIAILICCCGFAMVGLKQMADAKADQANIVNEEMIQMQSSVVTRDVEETDPSAETGIPLVSAYDNFNTDEAVSASRAYHSCNDEQTVTSRLTLVPAGSSLSSGAEAINVDVPPGTLELTLSNADNGWPLIERVGTSSEFVKAGDRLAFIDGIDTRTINTEDLTNMMSEACEHSRRLTLLRDHTSI